MLSSVTLSLVKILFAYFVCHYSYVVAKVHNELLVVVSNDENIYLRQDKVHFAPSVLTRSILHVVHTYVGMYVGKNTGICNST